MRVRLAPTRLVEFQTSHVQLLELCFRHQEREINEGAFGAFAMCPDTNRLVRGRYVQDPVRVDIEGDVNLKNTTWRWRDPIEMAFPKQITVLGHCTLSLEDLSENTWLAACVRLERLSSPNALTKE